MRMVPMSGCGPMKAMGGLMELRPGPPLSALFLVLCAHASVSCSQLLPCGMSSSLGWYQQALGAREHASSTVNIQWTSRRLSYFGGQSLTLH